MKSLSVMSSRNGWQKIETMGFPPDDRYKVIHELDSERLQFQDRDGDRLIMHLVMRKGRSDESTLAF
jgi:hypothetical protein